MHEASLAISILEQIKDYEGKNRLTVEKAVLEVGKGSGVNVASLLFCLNELKKQFDNAVEFEFVERPIKAACDSCGRVFELEYPTLLCPYCGELAIVIKEGMEFNILEFEVS